MPVLYNKLHKGGPCAKQVVTATLVDKQGNHYVGTNYCENPQPICLREGMPSGVGYEFCVDVCKQPAHAEVNAIRLAQIVNTDFSESVIYLEGHTYPCNNCQSEASKAGVSSIVVGPPPHLKEK